MMYYIISFISGQCIRTFFVSWQASNYSVKLKQGFSALLKSNIVTLACLFVCKVKPGHNKSINGQYSYITNRQVVPLILCISKMKVPHNCQTTQLSIKSNQNTMFGSLNHLTCPQTLLDSLLVNQLTKM